MASPQNWFREPARAELQKIKALKIYNGDLVKRNKKVLIATVKPDNTLFIFVRFEGKNCQGEYCLTVFFINDISEFNFSGVGLFPPKVALGDVWRRLCNDCDRIIPLVFYASDGRAKSVGLSRAGILF